jgi:hypothetical protein
MTRWLSVFSISFVQIIIINKNNNKNSTDDEYEKNGERTS